MKVSLSATSPNGTVLVQKQAIGDLGDFVFANPTASPINVTGLTFNRIGVSNDSTLTNVYLYNNGTRITDSAGVTNGQFSYNDPNGLFTVPAGMTYTVSVRSDIADSTSGQQIGVSLVSVSSSGTLDSSTSFPINSGYQTISAATLAGVSYGATVTPNSATSISPQSDYPVWMNTVSVSTNPVKLTSLKFTNLGSIDSAYLTNLRLYVDGTQVGSAIPTMAADRTVTFDLSAAPVTLSTQSHTLKVLANVTGGANRTIVFSVQRASDGMFVDSQLNQPVTPTSNGSTFSAESTGTVTINSVSGTSGVSVSLDPSSPTQNVAVGASNVDWADFDMLASGENVKVSDLYVYATDSVDATGGLYNGAIFVNGVQVGSTKNIGKDSANHTDFSLGSSLILPAGQSTKVSVHADAKNTAGTNLVTGQTVTVSLDSVANNAQGQSSLNSATVPAAVTSGNAITLSSSSLSAAMFSGYGNQTMIAGSNNARIGAFTLSAGSTEGVTVNTIEFTFPNAETSTLTNVTLKDDATGAVVGTVKTTPSTTNTYSVTLDVPASGSKTIDIYANILSGANAGTIKATLTTNTAGTGDSTGQTAAVTSTDLQTITIGKALLSAAIGAGNPTSAVEVAGASQVKAGQFTFTAQYSPFTVDSLAILVPANAATSVSNVSIGYTDVNGAAKTASAALHLSSGAQTYATAVFSGLTFYVPANSTADLNVYVDIPTIANGATSGAQISTMLDNHSNAFGGTGFHAVNSAGSATTTFVGGQIASTATTGQGKLVVRKSVPTFVAGGSAGALPIGANQTIGTFAVKADANGPVSWNQLSFTVSKAAGVTLGATSTLALWTDNGGSTWTQVTGTFATTTGSHKGGNDSFGAATSGTLQFRSTSEQQIAAGGSVDYQLRGTVADTSTTGQTAYVSISVQNPSSTVVTKASTDSSLDGTLGGATPSVVWSDRSSINPTHSTTSTDWTNDYLVPGLIMTMPTLQTQH